MSLEQIMTQVDAGYHYGNILYWYRDDYELRNVIFKVIFNDKLLQIREYLTANNHKLRR